MVTVTLALLPALLFAANPWPPLSKAELEAGITACGEEKAAAIERLGAQHAACTEDADCVGFEQVWLGCSGWRSIRAPYPGGLSTKIYAACAGIPALGQDCSGNVGACVSGRCMGRARAGVGCAEATAALLQKASETATCKTNDDCTTAWINRSAVAVSTRFWLEGAKASHAQEDACEEELTGRMAFEESKFGKATCVEERCRTVSADPPIYRKPRLRDATCITDQLRPILSRASKPGKATLKFFVGADGKTGAFQFQGTAPPGLREPLIWAVLGCAWEPGTRDGKPTPMWVVLPVNLR